MDASTLIARFLGPMMLVAGIALLANRRKMLEVFRDMVESPGLIFIAGVMALMVGVALVTFHNVWVADWRVFITVYGWLALLAGVVRMVFPDVAIGMGKRMMENRIVLIVAAVLNVLIGGFLSYMGFLA
jgi:uncharacterized membrane protein